MRISDWSSDVCSSDLLVAQIPEQLVEHLKIKQRRWAMARSHVKADGKLARVRFHSAPICLKPVGECLRFCFCIGKLDKAQSVTWCNSQAIGGEPACAGHNVAVAVYRNNDNGLGRGGGRKDVG